MANSSGYHRPQDLPPAVIEDVVAEPRRRAILRHLAAESDPVALPDLASAVAAGDETEGSGAVSAERRRQVCTELFQDHLPKLTATGIVDFDSLRGTVALRDAEIATYVE